MELDPPRSLSVVVYDEVDGDCRDLARSWTDARLLASSVWVPANQKRLSDQGAPTISAHFIAQGAPSDEQDLFTLIGVRKLDRVRVICLQLIRADGRDTSDVLETSTVIADSLRQLLPKDDSPSGAGIALSCINLIVPESSAEPISTEHIQAAWEINAVASPEDRPDLDQASIFVRRDLNLHAHATAAVASVGGLWPGMDSGIFDAHEADSTSSDTDLVVFRSSARLLQGDEPAQVLTNLALDAIRPTVPGSAQPPATSWGIPAKAPEQAIITAARELQSHGEWGRDLLRDMDPLVKTELSFKTAIGEFFRFQARLLFSAGRVIRNGAARIAEHAVTGALVGHRGDFVVRSSPRSPSDLIAYAQQVVDNQSEHLRVEYLEREIAKSTPPPSTTWADIRKLSFSLVDGGELPPGFTTPEKASTREFMPPTAIVPHPRDVFSLPDGTQIQPIDVTQTRSLAAHLTESIAAADAANQAASPNAGENPDGTAAAPVPPVHEPQSAPDDIAWTNVGDPKAQLSRLETWVENRRNSLLWKAAEQTIRRQRHAQEAASKSVQRATDTSLPDPTDVLAARTLLILIWTVVAAAWLSATLLALLVYHNDFGWDLSQLNLAKTATAVAPWVVLGIGACFLGGWKYYRALSRYEWKVRNSLAERRHAADTFVVASRESERLATLESGLQEWAAVIGWFLHQPWLTPEAEEFGVDVNPDQLPASVALASVEADSEIMPRQLIESCVREICVPGWTTNMYDQVNQLRVEEENVEQDMRRERIVQQPDAIAAFAAQEETRFAVAKQMGRKVHDLIAERRIVIPPRIVTRLGRYAGPDPMEDDEFFAGALGPQTPFVAEIWTDSGRVSGRNRVERSEVWLPPMRSVAGARRQTQAPVAMHRSSADTGIRIDFSVECQPSDIKLFKTRSAAAQTTTPEDDTSWN